MSRIPPTTTNKSYPVRSQTSASRRPRQSTSSENKQPSVEQSRHSQPTVFANARFQGSVETRHDERRNLQSRETLANAKYRGVEETSTSRKRGEAVANAKYSETTSTSKPNPVPKEAVANASFENYLKQTQQNRSLEKSADRYQAGNTNNPFRVTTPGDESKPKPTDPSSPDSKSEDSKPTDPSGFKYDARRNEWDSKFAKLGIAMKDPHGDYVSNVVFSSTSGVQEKVGYAVPGGSSEFGLEVIKALKKNGVDTLTQAMSKFSFRNIMQGLTQKPLFVHADKVGGVDFKDSVFNIGSEANRAGVKDGSVKNLILSTCGGDGGNINFWGEAKKVAGAFKDKFDAKVIGLLNNTNPKKMKEKFKEVHDWAMKNKDKAVNLAFYYSGHGNWNHNGKKQGEATSWNQTYSEKQLKEMVAMFKDTPNVGISLNQAACHAGGGIV